MNRLKIALIVSPWYPVPPVGYGGIELVAYNLACEMARRGHEVSVLGQEGSKGPFKAVALAPADWTSQLGTREHVSRENLFLYRVREHLHATQYDLIHDHSGLTGILLDIVDARPEPMIATLHGDLTQASGEFLSAVDDLVHLVAISRSQQAHAGAVRWSGMVYNAVDPAEFRPVDPSEKQDYIVQLARINSSKGQHIAIEVARRLGVKLVLAGKVDPGSKDYFKREVEPHLGKQVEWRENVHSVEKAQLLAHAKAMIFPIQWEEPFGLAMVEAMMSGTPVIAIKRGAAIEIVEPGVTGLLADDADGLVAAYPEVAAIDTRRCVARAIERFGPRQMGDGYEAVYSSALKMLRPDFDRATG